MMPPQQHPYNGLSRPATVVGLTRPATAEGHRMIADGLQLFSFVTG